MNMSGNYSYLEGGEGMRNDGWSLFRLRRCAAHAAHDWRISMNVFGQTPWIMLQGKGSSFFDYGV